MKTTPNAPLRLAFIGMSGSGKTFWTRRLAAAGYPALSCDDRIEERLGPHLTAGGYAGIGGVAAWMGWPDSPHYAEREAHYLREEIAVLEETLGALESHLESALILDTTGSVIYAGDAVLRRLCAQMMLVYLEASADEEQLLIERYLHNPKPVLWRGAFRPRAGETPRETVKRCYPDLIAERRSRYEGLAHCRLAIRELRESSLDAAGLLRRIGHGGSGAVRASE